MEHPGFPHQLQVGLPGATGGISSSDPSLPFPERSMEIARTIDDCLRVHRQSTAPTIAERNRLGFVVAGIQPTHSSQRELGTHEMEPYEDAGSLRGRLSGPMLFVTTLIETWRLARDDAVPLLGFEESDRHHVYNLLDGGRPLSGRDTKDRIVYLFDIRRTLSALFRSIDVENEWLREPHSLLKDQSPIYLLLEGSMENLLLVREYAREAAGR